MTSIKVEESTVECENGHVNPAELCVQPGDIIAWGYTSINNLACSDCGGAVKPHDVETLW